MINFFVRHSANRKSLKLFLIIIYPLVFYTGEARYTYSTDILSLFNDPAGLAKHIYFKPFQLVEINQIPDEALKQQVWLGVMELAMKHVFARDILPYLEDMINLLQAVEKAGGSQYIQTALTYLLTTGEISSKEAFLQVVQTHLSSETGESIMTIAQQFEAQGIKKGIEQGVEQGFMQAKKTIAQKLLQKGNSIGEVIEVTGLALFEVQALANQIAEH